MFAQTKAFLGQAIQDHLVAWGVMEAWLNLSTKDRRALKGLAWILGLAGLYFLVWQPVMQAQQKAETQLQKAQADWQWLNQQLPKLNSAQPQVKVLQVRSQAQLSQVLQRSLAQLNLSKQMTEMKPQQVKGKDGLALRFDKVMAPRFFRWLSQLEQQGLVAHKMQVKSLETGWISVEVQFAY